jgi:hypothetical protein
VWGSPVASEHHSLLPCLLPIELPARANYLDGGDDQRSPKRGPQMQVNRSDFVVLSPTRVRHEPTGATFTSYPPPYAGYDMIVRIGRAGEGQFPTIDELREVAWELLQELSRNAA